MRRRWLTGGLLAFVALFLSTAAIFARETSVVSESLEVGGLKRTFLLHIPAHLSPDAHPPLVIVLHGGGGKGRSMVRFSGFNKIADREGFIVVYPDGYGRHWNDGRGLAEYKSQKQDVDDVLFIRMLIDNMQAQYAVDSARVYAVGASNGGMMTYRLAGDLTDRFAAVACVIANMPRAYAARCVPAAPMPIMIVNGTRDPLMPWDGGSVGTKKKSLGLVVSTEESVAFWVKHNGCAPSGDEQALPDTNPEDGTRAWRTAYVNSKSGVEVLEYRIENGGHTWPGGVQYLPKSLIGSASHDFDTSEEIWSFFKRHVRK